MPRFFVDLADVGPETIVIREDVHHIANVLRMREGDILTLCDGQGTDYETSIQAVQNDQILCRILSRERSQAEPLIQIALFQGLPKSDKMETILQKGTELGISAFIPVEMKRSVARSDAKKDPKKRERWQKIAESAAKQSGRGRIPTVEGTVSLAEILPQIANFDLFLVPYENGQEHPLKIVLNGKEKPLKAAILIGPEGGIDPSEIEKLTQAGAVIVGLGPRILRTETAGPAASAMLLYHFDEM